MQKHNRRGAVMLFLLTKQNFSLTLPSPKERVLDARLINIKEGA